VIAPDTSVLVAGFAESHVFHATARPVLLRVKDGGSLVAHTIAETIAVSTHPTGPHGATSGEVLEYLGQFLEHPPIGVSPPDYPGAIAELVDAGVEGASIYDGLIAIAARDSGATLISLDARAAPTYRLAGVEFELLSEAR
jgi:predicted nucleic acid-binding protein